MEKRIFDYEDGDFARTISDTMAMDSDGNLLLRMSDHTAMDMDSGEIHHISGWSRDKDNENKNDDDKDPFSSSEL